jgi:NADH-quinone oxidoreductase subunit K
MPQHINSISHLDFGFLLFNNVNIINLLDYLCLSYLVFLIGLFGLLFNYKNFLISMLSVELFYFGLINTLVITSLINGNMLGQIYALTLLIVAASESAIGLGILIVLFKYNRTVDFSDYQELKN